MRLIVTGGGTGGHIYPAVSIAESYKKKHKNTKVLYVGRKQGLEADLVPKMGLNFQPISIEYKKSGFMGVLKHVFSLLKSMYEAKKIIQEFKPDMIVGTGGYVSGPVMLVGALMGVKTAVHEANAFPGRANKFLSRFVDRVMISFQESEDAFKDKSKVVLTGNPVRQEFYNLDQETCKKKLGIDKDQFLIFSVGGSGGAKRMNDVIGDFMSKVSGDKAYKVIHVTGKAYYEKLMKQLQDMRITYEDNIQVVPYVYDMPLHMGAADLMITRAGALTLAEISVTGTPAVYIPSPNVKDDHQVYNARTMERAGAGIVMLEEDLESLRLLELVSGLKTSPEKREKIRNSCLNLPGKDAMDRIVKTIEDVVKA